MVACKHFELRITPNYKASFNKCMETIPALRGTILPGFQEMKGRKVGGGGEMMRKFNSQITNLTVN